MLCGAPGSQGWAQCSAFGLHQFRKIMYTQQFHFPVCKWLAREDIFVLKNFFFKLLRLNEAQNHLFPAQKKCSAVSALLWIDRRRGKAGSRVMGTSPCSLSSARLIVEPSKGGLQNGHPSTRAHRQPSVLGWEVYRLIYILLHPISLPSKLGLLVASVISPICSWAFSPALY